MDWKRAVTFKHEELEAQKRQRSLAEVRAQSRDRRRPADLGEALPELSPAYRPSPVPGGRLVVPSELPLIDAGGASPFSLEALIAAELNAQTVARAQRPPRIPLLPELKRRPVPTPEPKVEVRTPPDVLPGALPILARRPAAVVVWTDRAWYGGQPDDLSRLSAWAWERRDEQRPPVWIRGELILDPWQLYETLLLGGDGVVLELVPLSDMQLEDLLGTAQELGLTLLPHVWTLEQAERVVELGLPRIAVGSGSLLDSHARLEASRGPLRELLADLPRELKALSWGGCTTLEELDTRAMSGVQAIISGRQFLSLHLAQDHRSQQEG